MSIHPATMGPAASAGTARIDHATGAEWFDGIAGERLAIRVRAAEVGGRLSVMESIAAAGCAAPLHTHREEELFHVIAGRATFRLGESILEARPGDVVVIPAGTPHAWINPGPGDLHMVATFSPGGIEEMFTWIAGLAPEAIAALAARYGSVVLGPPMRLDAGARA